MRIHRHPDHSCEVHPADRAGPVQVPGRGPAQTTPDCSGMVSAFGGRWSRWSPVPGDPGRGAMGESVCTPGSVPSVPEYGRRRPSIYACRRRQALAAYPQTRTGRPRTSAQATPSRRWPFLALLRVGFTEPPRSPGVLVGSYPTVSPLPLPPRRQRRSVFCGTVPRVTPGCR